MADLTAKQNNDLIKNIKAGKNQAQCAEALGLTPGQLGMNKFCAAQVEAGIVSKAPATEKSVKSLRAGGARWELIAAQTGLSVAKARELAGDTSPVKRGPKQSGVQVTAGTKATTGKANTRAAGKGGKTQAATPPRARTRAERAARSGNPS